MREHLSSDVEKRACSKHSRYDRYTAQPHNYHTSNNFSTPKISTKVIALKQVDVFDFGSSSSSGSSGSSGSSSGRRRRRGRRRHRSSSRSSSSSNVILVVVGLVIVVLAAARTWSGCAWSNADSAMNEVSDAVDEFVKLWTDSVDCFDASVPQHRRRRTTNSCSSCSVVAVTVVVTVVVVVAAAAAAAAVIEVVV